MLLFFIYSLDEEMLVSQIVLIVTLVLLFMFLILRQAGAYRGWGSCDTLSTLVRAR